MGFADVAKEVFEITRRFYESGRKSANKQYTDQRDVARVADAGRFLDDFRANKGLWSKGPIGYGSIVYMVGNSAAAGPWGANCGELAAVACYLSYKMAVEPRQISILMLEAPGDHALCLLCNPADLPPVHTAVDGLVRAPNRAWVVDAWLNVCCALPDYPARAQAKFAKWTTDGKRVAWAGKNGKEPGWYPPQGDYSKVFGKARIEYIPGVVAAE